MKRSGLLLAAAGGVVAFATYAHAATTPFGVAPPPEQGGSPIGGPLSPVFLWIAQLQQQFYGGLVASMGDIKANPWAAWTLLGLSFVYGVFHAAGPGHGKAVISGYLVATGESVRRGIVLSFLSAFVQGLSAILIVGIAGAVLHVTAVTMNAATSWLEVGSSALIALVGAWLLWSKTFGGHTHSHFHGPLPAGEGHHDDHDHEGHDHDHHDHDHAPSAHAHHHHDRHDHHHPDCHDHDEHAREEEQTHDHDFAAVAKAASLKTASPLTRAWTAIFAVGIRPCSGALIILVFALSQGIFVIGAAATFVMALGTGLTVATLATLAVSARGLATRFAGADSPRTEKLMHAGEIGIAAAVLIFGLLLVGGSIAGLPSSS